ncbi:MAG TPA: TIGR03435 family protein [Bryobacteraceae bacterium]|nr:TIGR03435 family protein [Bryobacteraceae bacterium]
MKFQFLLPFAAFAALAQTPTAQPTFEVATIKPAAPITPQAVQAGKMHVGVAVDAARVDIGFFSLYDLLYTAYKVKPYQVEGPDWLRQQRFDILAKMPDGATKDDMPVMLQALLKDRFKLEVHHDKKEHSALALVVAKGGIKMKEAEPDPAPLAEPAAPAKGEMVVGQGENSMRMKMNSDGKSGEVNSAKTGKVKYSISPDGMMHYEYAKLGMSDLADALAQLMGQPVVDATDLKGKYQIALDFSMQDLMAVAKRAGFDFAAAAGNAPNPGATAAETASDPGSSSFLSALQRLGLRLESRKIPIEMIVVDHVEKMPTEN